MNNIAVVKFGGTSLHELTHLGVINKILSDFPNKKVVCVLSAKFGITQDLIKDFNFILEKSIEKSEGKRTDISFLQAESRLEYDLFVSYGEIMSIIEASTVGKASGIRCLPLTGWQAGIESNSHHGFAAIQHVNVEPILQALSNHEIVFVAGFQASTKSGFVTTLGRGSSDLSAIAIAGALALSDVYIYTDVDAIYSADPRRIDEEKLKKISKISFEEALEIASFGGKVIHDRAVSLAQKNCTRIHIRNSQQDQPNSGSIITSKYDIPLKNQSSILKAVVFRENISVFKVPVSNSPGVTQKLIAKLTDSEINPSNILQSISSKNSSIEFIVNNNESELCNQIMQNLVECKELESFSINYNLSELSIIGSIFDNQTGIISLITKIFTEQNIKIKMLYANGIRISIVLDKEVFDENINDIYSKLSIYI